MVQFDEILWMFTVTLCTAATLGLWRYHRKRATKDQQSSRFTPALKVGANAVKPSTSKFLLRYCGLRPQSWHLPLIRGILERHIEERQDNEIGRRRFRYILAGTDDLLLLCCAQLYFAAQVEDVLPIWRAKTCDFDARCYLDDELLLGAGYEATQQFLSISTMPDATCALAYLQQCQPTLGYAQWLHRYFTPENP